jgi:protein associated with RNAse G/E
MDPVRVVWRKFDGSLHWTWSGLLLGEDDHGVWVGTPAGTPTHRGSTAMGRMETASVIVFPRAGWWSGTFNAAPHHTEVYCDVNTVPHWPSPAEVTMIDLDLDVLRRRGGEVELVDEDEFAAHQVRYAYPPDVVATAQSTADWLLGVVKERVEPFGSAYHRWLELVK